MYRELRLSPVAGPFGAGAAVRYLAAEVLRRASAVLARMALGMAGAAAQAPGDDPVFEFHAEAGAPEGALYVDGVLVGTLAGVDRL
jgi:hypothetical protein